MVVPDPDIATIALTGISAGLGWWLRILWDANANLAKNLSELERSLPDTYVRRDDFRDTISLLIARFDRLEGKIDSLQEKLTNE